MTRHRPIRLLIVDDSRFIRTALRSIVAGDPDIEVSGEASDGGDAIVLARMLRPDVITMDMDMPEVDGLEAIERIMAERPTPIIVLSGHTRAGIGTTFQALERGAVDFLEKPALLHSMETRAIEGELLTKIHHWARRPHGAPWGGEQARTHFHPLPRPPSAPKLILPPAVIEPLPEPNSKDIAVSGCDTNRKKSSRNRPSPSGY